MDTIKAIIIAVCFSTTACAQTQEQTNGALIGGALGAWIGNGGGHQKEAALGGAALGYLLGNATSNNRSTYVRQPYTYRDFRNECSQRVPLAYRNNHGTESAWINGCVNRMQQEQQMLERDAYNSGLSNP